LNREECGLMLSQQLAPLFSNFFFFFLTVNNLYLSATQKHPPEF